MSVQNNLKKPEFTKTMLGYTPKEVDQYIDHILERYAAVSRDVTELKRRVTRLQLGMESEKCVVEDRTADESAVYTGLSDSVMDKLRHMIESERRRHEEAMDALMSFLESHSRDEELQTPAEEIPLFADEAEEAEEIEEVEVVEEEAEAEGVDIGITFEESDSEWEDALEKFISDASEDTEPEVKEEDLAEEDTDSLLEKLFGKYDITLDSEAEEVEEETEEEEAEEIYEELLESEDVPVHEKTPAEIAAELDFYSDGTVHNGESYDPMTLAANATMKRRRPTLEDFMRPLPDEDKKG